MRGRYEILKPENITRLLFTAILLMGLLASFSAVRIVLAAQAASPSCAELDGASIYSDDGMQRYLGFFGTFVASDSVMNLQPYNPYGSSWWEYSLRNRSGVYGDDSSSYSAANPQADKPPRIVNSAGFITYLTTNSSRYPDSISLAGVDGSCTFTASIPQSVSIPTTSPTDTTTDSMSVFIPMVEK